MTSATGSGFFGVGIEMVLSSLAVLISLIAAYISFHYRRRSLFLQSFENIAKLWQSEEFTRYKKMILEDVPKIKNPFPMNHLEEYYAKLKESLLEEYLEKTSLEREKYLTVINILKGRKDLQSSAKNLKFEFRLDEKVIPLMREHVELEMEKEEELEDYKKYVIPMRRIVNFFEGVGVRWFHGYVDKHLVKDILGLSIIRYWNVLRPFIEMEREWSGLENYYYNFQRLAEAMEKTHFVLKREHPS